MNTNILNYTALFIVYAYKYTYYTDTVNYILHMHYFHAIKYIHSLASIIT